MLRRNSVLILIAIFTFSLLSGGFAADILYDILPFVRVHKDGTVKRFIGTKRVPASFDPTTGVQSKDIRISPQVNVSARIYLPNDAAGKLPVLVYFHGGGFFTESAFSPTYHNHLNLLVGKAYVIAVSVEYKLAPEHPLPVAYEDSWLALNWVFSHREGKGQEAWINRFADFGRVYLGGDSAGGNIAHNMAMRAGLGSPENNVKLNGIFLNCPHFSGKKPIGNEMSRPIKRNIIEKIWLYAYPNSTGLDDPLVNPSMDPKLSKLGCKRVMVFVAGLDFLRDRGFYYKKALDKSGWIGSAEVIEVKGEDHVFNLINPSDPKAVAVLETFASFLNNG